MNRLLMVLAALIAAVAVSAETDPASAVIFEFDASNPSFPDPVTVFGSLDVDLSLGELIALPDGTFMTQLGVAVNAEMTTNAFYDRIVSHIYRLDPRYTTSAEQLSLRVELFLGNPTNLELTFFDSNGWRGCIADPMTCEQRVLVVYTPDGGGGIGVVFDSANPDVVVSVTIATPTPTPTPTPIPISLSRSQQACANEMNRYGEKVNKAKLRENERCMMDFQRGKLMPPMTFSSCSRADRMDRVQKAEDRTAKREDRKCDPLDAPPPLAYSDSATVNAAAISGGWWLTRQLFGSPSISDTGLATKASDPEAAKCQLEVLRRAGKLENTILKEFVKAQKRALEDEIVGSGSALAARLAAVFSSNARVERTRAALDSGADRKCSALQVPPAEIFAGHCGDGDPDLRGVELCAIVEAHCAACAMINAFDDLNLDCDQLDDQIVNGSCPEFASVSPLTNADCFPSTAPDSASPNAKICIELANSKPDMLFTPADYQGLPEDCKALVNPICR